MKHFVRTLAKLVITEAATALATSAAAEAGQRIVARLLPCDDDGEDDKSCKDATPPAATAPGTSGPGGKAGPTK